MNGVMWFIYGAATALAACIAYMQWTERRIDDDVREIVNRVRKPCCMTFTMPQDDLIDRLHVGDVVSVNDDEIAGDFEIAAITPRDDGTATVHMAEVRT